jgi:chloramphenicol-sensitive protein RarD
VSERPRRRDGLLYALGAYGLWGVMPLYFAAVRVVPPFEVLMHRVVWSFVVLAGLITVARRWPDLARCFRDRRLLAMLALSTVLIGVNWYVFILGVSTRRALQASLGYYVTPLVSVTLGLAFFGERLRPLQWVALLLAASGLAYLFWGLGEVPWITLALAGVFGLYGVVRKVAPVESLAGLTMETLLLTPVACAFLLAWHLQGTAVLGKDAGQDALLLLCGPATAIPLLFFGAAARRLPLTTLGFLQYLSPSIQFAVAIYGLGEHFLPAFRVCFVFTWLALAVFTADSLLRARPAATVDRTTLEERPGELEASA